MKIKGSGASKPAPKKKPSVAPKKAAAAVKKATYQVPKKLTKPTKANIAAGNAKTPKQKAQAAYNKKALAEDVKKLTTPKAKPKKPAGKVDEMAQGNKALKQLWEKKNRLNK